MKNYNTHQSSQTLSKLSIHIHLNELTSTMDPTRTSLLNSQEDQILTSFVKKYGVGSWVQISQKMQHRANTHPRSGKQCRQRWHNHLDPEVSKKSWSLQQQKTMFEAHKKYGNKWSDIASELSGRTDSDVKNHFYSIIRKCLRRLSKMVGQKNSTQKIRNVRPSVLSRLLEGNNDSKSKETSEALFKFILQRQNLNFKSLDKKTRDVLENLVDRIASMNEDQSDVVKSFISQNDSEQEKTEKKPQMVKQSSRILRSSMEIKSEQKIVQHSTKNPKKLPKVKKIKKQPSIKSQRRDSKISTTGKENNSYQEVYNFGIDVEIPEISDRQPSFRLGSMISEMHHDGFRSFDADTAGQGLRRMSLRSRESVQSDHGLFPDIRIDFNMEQLRPRRRSSLTSENRRMMSTNDNYTSFCVTPPVPTPSFDGNNLFETFRMLSPGQLTIGGLNQNVNELKQSIERNNRPFTRLTSSKSSVMIDFQ